MKAAVFDHSPIKNMYALLSQIRTNSSSVIFHSIKVFIFFRRSIVIRWHLHIITLMKYAAVALCSGWISAAWNTLIWHLDRNLYCMSTCIVKYLIFSPSCQHKYDKCCHFQFCIEKRPVNYQQCYFFLSLQVLHTATLTFSMTCHGHSLSRGNLDTAHRIGSTCMHGLYKIMYNVRKCNLNTK